MFTMNITVTLLFFLSAITSVVAHGVISEVLFRNEQGGTSSRIAPLPGQGGANDSPIRSVSSQDPNYGTNNPAITCGPDSKAGNEVAEIAPGAEMSFVWKDASGGPWAHDIGPIITYMASCGNQDCNNAGSPADLLWFKIEEVGRKDNSDEWVQADVKKGSPSTTTIPENLAPGNYMVRHEIIALHIATEKGKAEFYPGCVAVKVTGTGSGVPKASDLVRFPGTYKDDDPGIFTPNIFDSNVEYAFPGPKVATFAANSLSIEPRTSDPDAMLSTDKRSSIKKHDIIQPRSFGSILARLASALFRAGSESAPIESRNSDTKPATEKRSTEKGVDTIQPRRVLGVIFRLIRTGLRGGASSASSMESRSNGVQSSTEKRSIAKDVDTIDIQPRRILGVLFRLVSAGLRGGASSSLESRTSNEPSDPSTPNTKDHEEAIMVPRRYSRIMKRLVDDLAKNGKLPQL